MLRKHDKLLLVTPDSHDFLFLPMKSVSFSGAYGTDRIAVGITQYTLF